MGMLGSRTLLVSNFPMRLIHILRFVGPYIFEVHLHNLRILKILFEFESCPWYGIFFIIFLCLPSKRICHRDKEVGRGLAIGRDVTHVDEILPSKLDRAKIDHFSLVDKANFIEGIIKRLSGLVYRDDGGDMNQICSDSEGTNIFKSCARVKTAGGAKQSQLKSTPQTKLYNTVDSLVPRGDQTSRRQSLTNSVEVASRKKKKKGKINEIKEIHTIHASFHLHLLLV